MTLKQVATLLVRFFGFQLLFYGVLGLVDFPGYWVRSTFSHSLRHSFDTSFDVTLVAYCAREALHFVAGMYFLGQARKVAEVLLRGGDDQRV